MADDKTTGSDCRHRITIRDFTPGDCVIIAKRRSHDRFSDGLWTARREVVKQVGRRYVTTNTRDRYRVPEVGVETYWLESCEYVERYGETPFLFRTEEDYAAFQARTENIHRLRFLADAFSVTADYVYLTDAEVGELLSLLSEMTRRKEQRKDHS